MCCKICTILSKAGEAGRPTFVSRPTSWEPLIYDCIVFSETNIFNDLVRFCAWCQCNTNELWTPPLITRSLESVFAYKSPLESLFKLLYACSCLRLYIFHVIQIWWSCQEKRRAWRNCRGKLHHSTKIYQEYKYNNHRTTSLCTTSTRLPQLIYASPNKPGKNKLRGRWTTALSNDLWPPLSSTMCLHLKT